MRTASALLGLPLLALLALSLSVSPAQGRLLKDAAGTPEGPFLLRMLKDIMPTWPSKKPNLMKPVDPTTAPSTRASDSAPEPAPTASDSTPAPAPTTGNVTTDGILNAAVRDPDPEMGILGSRRKKCPEGFYRKRGKCIKKKGKKNKTPKATTLRAPEKNQEEDTGAAAGGGGDCDSAYGKAQCDIIREVLKLTNGLRKSEGKNTLCLDNKLIEASKVHTEDMVDKNYFSHTGSDGSSPWDRLDRVGFPGGSGENVAFGQQTPEAVYKAWLGSSGHKANMVGSGNRMGLYFKSGKWTQMFGTGAPCP